MPREKLLHHPLLDGGDNLPAHIEKAGLVWWRHLTLSEL